MKWFQVESQFGHHPTIQRILNTEELGTSALGSLVLLWAFAASYGRDELRPGRCVDREGDPIAKADLLIAGHIPEAQFDALITVLVSAKAIDVDAWNTREELSFPGLTSRADNHTKTIIRNQEKAARARGRTSRDAPVPERPSLLPAPLEYELASQPAQTVTPTPTRFDAFWSLYPRKQSKKKALAVWKSKAFQCERDTQLYETIMTGLRAQVASWTARATDPAHICHADQFLKHRRWEDEPLTITSKDTSVSDLQASRERFRARQSAGIEGEH